VHSSLLEYSELQKYFEVLCTRAAAPLSSIIVHYTLKRAREAAALISDTYVTAVTRSTVPLPPSAVC